MKPDLRKNSGGGARFRPNACLGRWGGAGIVANKRENWGCHEQDLKADKGRTTKTRNKQKPLPAWGILTRREGQKGEASRNIGSTELKKQLHAGGKKRNQGTGVWELRDVREKNVGKTMGGGERGRKLCRRVAEKKHSEEPCKRGVYDQQGKR